MTRTILLDCTLRDGGYYNAWDFQPDLASDLVAALDRSGVDIIELGYRSRLEPGSYGMFRFCDERLLRALVPATSTAEYAFMLDANEFLDADDRADVAALRAVICPAKSSLFTWTRIATHPGSIDGAIAICSLLKEWGYKVSLNIMGISTLDAGSMATALAKAKTTPLDVLYLADSLGSLTPETTLRKIDEMRAAYDGRLGVHMHDNLGLALANTLAAIDHGIEFADVTVAGMGRGAGNLRTEQLLLALSYRHGRRELVPSALLDVLKTHLLPLQERLRWGWDFPYMLSGLVGIHPTYCQELKTSGYDLEEVSSILEQIPAEKCARFDHRELCDAESRHRLRRNSRDT